MSKLGRIKRAVFIGIINKFMCGTHFFTTKRRLLNAAGISTGAGTKIVGPIYLGNVSEVSFGNCVWVGMNFAVYGNGRVDIRDNIDIAPDVSFATGSHEVSNSSKRRAGKGIAYQIIVGSGSWIGTRSTIVGGGRNW